jgi:hypothetical protein
VGHKSNIDVKGPKQLIKAQRRRLSAEQLEISGHQVKTLCPTKGLLLSDFDVYIKGNDGVVHKARLRVKNRKTNRYLYIAYRDGEKIVDRYVAKLEGVKP